MMSSKAWFFLLTLCPACEYTQAFVCEPSWGRKASEAYRKEMAQRTTSVSQGGMKESSVLHNSPSPSHKLTCLFFFLPVSSDVCAQYLGNSSYLLSIIFCYFKSLKLMVKVSWRIYILKLNCFKFPVYI